MKALRVLLLVLAGLVLLVAVLVFLAFVSPVQTWAARRALASQADVAGEIGRLDIGLRHVRAENVVLRTADFVLRLPQLDADLAVLDAARREVRVERLVAKGWTLDLTASGAARAGAPDPALAAAAMLAVPPPLNGATDPKGTPPSQLPVGHLLAALELPVDIAAVDGVELEGEVVLPPAEGASPTRATVAIAGGGLTVAEPGNFTVRAQVAVPAPDAPVAGLDLESAVEVNLASPRTFQRLAVSSIVETRGGQVPDGTRLRINAEAGGTAEGDAYRLDLRTENKTLMQLEATPEQPGTGTLAGNWQLDVTREDIAPFTLGLTLPAFAAEGRGHVQYVGTNGTARLGGQLNVAASELATVRPELSAVGRLDAHTEFEVRYTGQTVRVTRFGLELRGEQPLAQVRAMQGAEFDLESGELRVADPDSDLLDVQLQGLPLAWAAPFVPDLTLAGGPLQGAWRAAARDGGFVVRSVTPLRLGGLSVSQQDRVLVRELDLALAVSGEYLPNGWQARLERGHVQSGTTRLLEFDGRAGQASAAGAPLVATSRFRAEVVPLSAQPVAEALRQLQAGRASGEFIVALGERMEMAAELDLAGLVAADGQALPRVVVDVRADRAADGRIEAHIPVRVTQAGRASDLTLDAQARPTGEGFHIDAVVAGQHVFIQDVQLLAAPLAGQEGAADPEESDAGRPPWAGVEGKLTFTFGTVVYSDALAVNDVSGEVALGEESLRVPDVRGQLGTGGAFQFKGNLGFDAARPQPYELEGTITASDVEVGALMRALAPDQPPPVEGRFNFTSTLGGQARDLAGLAADATLEAQLSSRGGVLRALPVKYAQTARSGGGALAGVAGLIGGLTGDSRFQRVAEASKAAAEFAQAVEQVAFDQLNLEVTRTPEGEIAVKDLSLISPMLRLLGAGGIRNAPDTPFWQAPLNVSLQLSARGALAENLKKLRLLRDTADTLGYAPMVEDFQLEGSLTNIVVPQLQSLLSRALAGLRE